MAESKKKTVAKKKAAAKTGGKKTGGKKTERKRDGKGLVVTFMKSLIAAGHIEEIPEEPKEQHKEAQRIRQFAEKLARQTRKFGDEDFDVAGEDE